MAFLSTCRCVRAILLMAVQSFGEHQGSLQLYFSLDATFYLSKWDLFSSLVIKHSLYSLIKKTFTVFKLCVYWDFLMYAFLPLFGLDRMIVSKGSSLQCVEI